MKRRWTVLSARIDALSLRERAFLFFTLLLLCMLLANVLWLAPEQARYQRMIQRVAAQNTELQRLREELRNSSRETGPGRQMREERDRLRERIAAVNQEIAALPLAQAEDASLAKVLVHFLRRHEGLVLVRTATLAEDSRNAEGAPPTPAGLRRQGLELTVAGSYAELTRYVQTLERALPALRWGRMKLESRNQPAELTLQVWLVGASS